MAKEKKRQHVIPKCYLKTWCDPTTALAFLLLVGCGNPPKETHSLSTTQIFELRSKCGQLGERLLNTKRGDYDGRVLQVSHYNANRNRCYVRIRNFEVAPSGRTVTREFLFDGQTNEEIAWVSEVGGTEMGAVIAEDWKVLASSLGISPLPKEHGDTKFVRELVRRAMEEHEY